MCIIVAKPIGIEIPSKSLLQNCFIANRHGAGFMFNHNKKVYIYKGFMKFEAFYRVLQKTIDKYDLKNKGVVIHFRISTGGKIDEGNCHPYPISNDEEMLRKKKVITKDVAMAHNGTIRLFSGKHDFLNDTQLFIKNIVNTFYQVNHNFYLDKEVMETLQGIADSKLCFLDKMGELYMLGDFVEENGIYFSNLSYKGYSCIINSTTRRRPVFDDLYFQLDDERIIDTAFENLIKKVIFLDENEFVFSSTREIVYEGGDKRHRYAYDNDLNLYEIDMSRERASLIEKNIVF